MMPAIYNVADIFIVTMMICVALLVLVGLHLDGTREVAPQGRRHAAGRGRRVPAEGGVAGFQGGEFPVADPDAGAPGDREPRRDADG